MSLLHKYINDIDIKRMGQLMNLKKVLSTVFSLVILSGCVAGNNPTIYHTRTTTTGQELIDLQKAKDSDIITNEEFENTKEKLLMNTSMAESINL